MNRYEPTELGVIVSGFLPSSDNEHIHIMGNEPLVYADGSVVPYSDVPRYSRYADYNPVILRVKKAREENCIEHRWEHEYRETVGHVEDKWVCSLCGKVKWEDAPLH